MKRAKFYSRESLGSGIKLQFQFIFLLTKGIQKCKERRVVA